MAKRLASFAKAMGTNGSEIAALRAAEATASQGRSDAELLAFLFACNMDVTKASAKLCGAKTKMESLGPVTIADVAPFHRTPSKDRKLPDGCLVLLEDMKGGVARDVLGRPIMLAVGMQHGTVEEMCKQYLYVTQRAMQYALPNVPPGAACIVIDIAPQEKGAPVSFRFPDKDVRQIFDLQERCFPGALLLLALLRAAQIGHLDVPAGQALYASRDVRGHGTQIELLPPSHALHRARADAAALGWH